MALRNIDQFPEPVTLRAVDLADDIPTQLFALADLLRSLNADTTHMVSILSARQTDVGRTLSRVQAEAVQIRESAAGVQQSVETLTRTLRAAGRL